MKGPDHSENRVLLPAALAVLLCGACASTGGFEREPQLTNPPRHEAWQDLDEAAEEASRPAWEQKYDGTFRLPLTEDWTWQLPDDGHWALSRLELSTAAVAGEFLLVGSSRSPGLFVLERTTGRLVRQIELAGSVQAEPLAVEDGWVVVDTFGNVQRLSAELEPVWRQPYASGGAVFSKPVLSGDSLVVSTGADTVVAMGFDTGQWQWTFTRDVPRGSLELAILGAPSPVLVGDQLVVGFSDGSVSGLDPATGRELWREQVGGGKFPDIQAEALVIGDTLILAAFGGPVVALDIETRKRRWENSEAGATSAMIHAGGYIYTTDVQGRVLCLDSESGTQVWSWEHKEAQFGAPVRAGGSILVGDVAGSLHALDRFEGGKQWKYHPMDGTRVAGVAAKPAIFGRQVLITTAGGSLRSLIAEPLVGLDDSEEPANRRDRSLGW